MDIEASVRQVLIDFASALESRDLDAIGRVFVQDGALLFYGTHDKLHFTSWPALEGSFLAQFKALSGIKCAISGDIHVQTFAGGLVACAATAGFGMRAMMGDVPIDLPALRLTAVMERREGRFQVVQMHISASDRPFVESVKHVIARYFE